MQWASGDAVGAAICRPGSLLPQGAVSTGDAPPILFLVLPKKRMRRARCKRKRRWARSGAVALRARRGSAYWCLLRFCLAFGHAMAFCEVDTAVPWRMVRRASGCKDAFELLLFPRVPLRYALPWRSWRRVPHRTESLPRSRRGRCPHRPAGTGLCCCALAWRSWGAAYSTTWSQPRTSRWRG